MCDYRVATSTISYGEWCGRVVFRRRNNRASFIYRTKNQYPDGANESKKRAIRKKAKKFVVKDGELFC